MRTVICADGVAPAERFEYWQNLVSRSLFPVKLTGEHHARFCGRMHKVTFGAVQIFQVKCSDLCTRRSRKQICQSDPEMFQAIIPAHGFGVLAQGRDDAFVNRSGILLYDTWHSYSLISASNDDVPVAGLFAMLPSALLHLPANKIERRGPRTFSSVDGTGALLQGLLGQLIVRADQFQALEAARLGITVIDLLTIMLAHEHNLSAPPETRQRTLITQIHAFIHQRLSDPTLSPETIAAAHNISLRSLQRLFHAQGHAVAAWIRERRLDHCRRDLTDSRISHRPIHAIAARWGFTDAAHFTHTFRAAYGITPQDYRRQHLIEHT